MPADWRKNILQIFNSQAQLSPDAERGLLHYWKHTLALKRNDFLVSKGEVESKLFFVSSGSLRIFYPVKGEEICAGFAYTNSLICSYPSFIKQVSSEYSIQALKASRITFIARSDFYNLLENHRSLEKAWRLLEEEALIGKIEREIEMLAFTPEERYRRLMKRSPHIFQIIPKKYIASYLRMTPETLSRIKLR